MTSINEKMKKSFARGSSRVWFLFAALLVIALAACSSPTGTTQQPTAAVAQETNPTATAEPAAAPPAFATATTAAAVATTSAPAAATSAPTAGDAAAAQACNAPVALTPALTEGPYFKAGSPEQANLVTSGMAGTKLVLTGYVLDTNCRPVAHALLDFWQADANGAYDNSGYTLRGHQYTDASGRYQLTTVVPGLYPGRTEHIHVKVQAPNGPVVTTQLFFPGVANNERDGIYDPKLLITVKNSSGAEMTASFNFIVSGG